MEILSSPTFWIIIVAIILLMALVGYLSEGTDLIKKNKEKIKDDKKGEHPIEITEPSTQTLFNENQEQIENLNTNSNVWNNTIPIEKKQQPEIHNVDTIDDWSGLPNEFQQEKNQAIETLNLNNSPEIESLNINETPDILFPSPEVKMEDQTFQNNPSIDKLEENNSENIWR